MTLRVNGSRDRRASPTRHMKIIESEVRPRVRPSSEGDACCVWTAAGRFGFFARASAGSTNVVAITAAAMMPTDAPRRGEAAGLGHCQPTLHIVMPREGGAPNRRGALGPDRQRGRMTPQEVKGPRQELLPKPPPLFLEARTFLHPAAEVDLRGTAFGEVERVGEAAIDITGIVARDAFERVGSVSGI